ncbi:MAG: cytochrome c biogenesis protein ResB [Phycisphaerales bacterium]|nr:cytochrome c biogenesis protein ResB [Phycisphaerales bacterium]
MNDSNHHPHRIPRGLFILIKPLGSLWFGGLALMAWLVAMACATIYETRHGTAEALEAFYLANWFRWILAFLCLTVLATVVLRFPFTRKNLGFVLTHVSVPLIFAGAMITHLWGVNGQIGVSEGQTVSQFSTDQDALIVKGPSDSTPVSLELSDDELARLDAHAGDTGPTLPVGALQVQVLQHLVSSRFERSVVNDNPLLHPALELSVGPGSAAHTEWLFADQELEIGESRVAFRTVADAAEWEKLLAQPADNKSSATDGLIKITLAGVVHEVRLADCTGKAVAVGNTGLTAQVLRYLPHAVVGPDKKVVSGSDQPVNPAIELEVAGPQGTDRRFAFAKFPDFQHAKSAIEGLEVLFIAPQTGDGAAVQLLADPSGELYVRFNPKSGPQVTKKLTLGELVVLPGAARPFSVLRKYDHARIDWAMVPADPDSKQQKPGIQVALIAGSERRSLWLQKYSPRTESIAGASYEFMYGDKPTSLGFDVRLEKFRIGTYPGTGRPRSFESHVTFMDPAFGGQQSRVISMNHPAKFGGYTFYQSSYRQEEGKSISFLSVARDPGQPVVFAGYIGLLAGMLLVMRARILDHRRPSAFQVARRPVKRDAPSHARQEELVAV